MLCTFKIDTSTFSIEPICCSLSFQVALSVSHVVQWISPSFQAELGGTSEKPATELLTIVGLNILWFL